MKQSLRNSVCVCVCVCACTCVCVCKNFTLQLLRIGSIMALAVFQKLLEIDSRF